MHILKFIASHWHDILVGTILVATVITGVIQWVKIKGPIFNAMSSAEKISYVKRLLTNLTPIAISLVTGAEIDWGGKTGVIKKSQVIDELYSRIPDEFKKYVTVDNLTTIMDRALEEARELWKENPNLLSQPTTNTEIFNISESNTGYLHNMYLKED